MYLYNTKTHKLEEFIPWNKETIILDTEIINSGNKLK